MLHEDTCRHCSGKMSPPKVVLDGPKKGQTRKYCLKCGHIEFVAQTDPANLQQH